MPSEIPEAGFKSMLATEKFIGQVEERLNQGDKTMKEIKAQQDTLATKEEVFDKVDAGIAQHEQAYHPSAAQVEGEKVLARRAVIKAWAKGHPKESGLIKIISIIAVAYFGLDIGGLL